VAIDAATLERMPTLLGDSQSTSLIALDRRAHREFAEVMVALGNRRDRADAIADYAAAASMIGPGRFSLSDLARMIGSELRHRDRFRQLLERSHWDLDPMQTALLDSAVAAEIDAFAIELDIRIDEGGCGRDVLVLLGLGDGFSIPLQWQLVEYLPDHPNTDEAIRAAVLGLVEHFAGGWLAALPEKTLPPLLAADHTFGEDRRLRRALRSRSVTYMLSIPADYDEAVPVRHPYEDTEPERTLAELFGGGEGVIELSAERRPEAEYAVALPGGRFAIAHPEIEIGPGELLGHRPQRRVTELAELVAPQPGAIKALRVADFDYPSPQALERHAYILSAYSAFIRSRFVIGKEEP
jgi:hypothetical protein